MVLTVDGNSAWRPLTNDSVSLSMLAPGAPCEGTMRDRMRRCEIYDAYNYNYDSNPPSIYDIAIMSVKHSRKIYTILKLLIYIINNLNKIKEI